MNVEQEIVDFFKNPSITSKTNLRDDLCLDSLDIVELMVHLENKFKVEFEGEEFPPLETIGDLAKFTRSLIY